jgi:hypothetical protein
VRIGLHVLENDFQEKYNMYVKGNIYDVGDPIIKRVALGFH